MALSGPAANLMLVLAAAVCIRLGLAAGWFYPPHTLDFMKAAEAQRGGLMEVAALMLSILFSLNLVLFLFNMMPIAPLDGQAWMMLLLPEPAKTYYQWLMSMLPVRLLGFYLVWLFLGRLFGLVFRPLVNLLYLGYVVSY
jgi:Zn-dependent protease